jgi:hypothetical protein
MWSGGREVVDKRDIERRGTRWRERRRLTARVGKSTPMASCFSASTGYRGLKLYITDGPDCKADDGIAAEDEEASGGYPGGWDSEPSNDRRVSLPPT